MNVIWYIGYFRNGKRAIYYVDDIKEAGFPRKWKMSIDMLEAKFFETRMEALKTMTKFPKTAHWDMDKENLRVFPMEYAWICGRKWPVVNRRRHKPLEELIKEEEENE